MKSLSLKLPDVLDAKLAAVARRRGASKSAVVREALEAYVAHGGKVVPGSALDLARDLAGCLEGPGDLSYNKWHMRGFGR